MKIVIIAMLGLGLTTAKNVRETWKEICTEDSGNKCCTDLGQGMADAGATADDPAVNHQYWINRRQGSWTSHDIDCRLEKTGAKLAVFESRRESDCVTKYLIEEYDDPAGQQYAIGMKVDETFKGVYEWHRVDATTDNKAAATLTFTNWVPSAPTGQDCVAMTAGADDLNNGRWTDVDCDTSNTLYGICEFVPT